MIIVTGANGFIGRYLVQQLIDNGDDVLATGSSDKSKNYFKDKGIPYETIDVTKKEDFDKLPNSDAVVHLAALLRIDRDKHTALDYIKVNGYGTFNVLEYCYKVGAKIIYSQTHSDIDASKDIIISEKTERAFTSSHEISDNVYPFIVGKNMGMDLIMAYDNDGVIPAGIVFRLSNIRGYGSRDTRYNCVFHQLIQKAINGDPIEIWGDHKTVRDMIYVKDVVNAIIKAINSNTAHGLYTIGSGSGVTILDEAQAIINAFCTKKQSKIIFRPEIKEVRTKNTIFDISKAVQELKWKPQYTYEEAMIDYKKEMKKMGKGG